MGTNGEDASRLVSALSGMQGFDEFYKGCSSRESLYDVADGFLLWKRQHGCLPPEEETTLKILREKFELLEREESGNLLSGQVEHLAIRDPLVEVFRKDFHECRTGQVAIKRVANQHYKTRTEDAAYIGLNFEPVYHKYSKTNNPFINTELALAFDNAGLYSVGLRHLKKSLYYSLANPNPYWESPYEIYGCTEAIWEVQFLLGDTGLDIMSESHKGFRLKLLKLLYLYLSRSIHIAYGSLHSLQYLSNRATLLYDYYHEFTIIFGDVDLWVTNIDVQVMSDKAYAYSMAEDLGLAAEFRQDFWDSLKMYRYGSLIPFGSIGPLDLNDETMGDLNKRGWLRSIALGNRLYEEYKRGELHMDRAEIDDIVSYLKNTHPDKLRKMRWMDL